MWRIILGVGNLCLFLTFGINKKCTAFSNISPTWFPAMCVQTQHWVWSPWGVLDGCSSRETVMMIHCCAVGSQLTPLEHSILGGPACVLQRICLHPTQIFWHLIFTTLNHSRDKYKTKVTGNVIYMNPTSFTLSCLISEVLYLASISNNYYIHFKKTHQKSA